MVEVGRARGSEAPAEARRLPLQRVEATAVAPEPVLWRGPARRVGVGVVQEASVPAVGEEPEPEEAEEMMEAEVKAVVRAAPEGPGAVGRRGATRALAPRGAWAPVRSRGPSTRGPQRSRKARVGPSQTSLTAGETVAGLVLALPGLLAADRRAAPMRTSGRPAPVGRRAAAQAPVPLGVVRPGVQAVVGPLGPRGWRRRARRRDADTLCVSRGNPYLFLFRNKSH